MIKHQDYAPLAAPPNPRADEAREAMRAYMQPMLHTNSAPVVEAQVVDVDPPAPESCGEETEHDKISRVLAAMPPHAAHLARYAATARVFPIWDEQRGKWLSDVVTVTCFDKKGERE